MGTFLQDLRFAWNTMRRAPAFALAAVLTLAIGIGATTAIFSTVNAALLKPLPYPGAQDLYSIRTTLPAGRVTSGLLSPVEIVRLNDPSLSVVHVAGMQGNDVTLLRNDGTPLKTIAYAVSEGFFNLFGQSDCIQLCGETIMTQRGKHGATDRYRQRGRIAAYLESRFRPLDG